MGFIMYPQAKKCGDMYPCTPRIYAHAYMPTSARKRSGHKCYFSERLSYLAGHSILVLVLYAENRDNPILGTFSRGITIKYLFCSSITKAIPKLLLDRT